MSPKEAADRLGISAPTLRRWSVAFGDVLSPGARGPSPGYGRVPQRDYSEGDLGVLRRAKLLLDGGLSIEQARGELAAPPPPAAPAEPATPALAALQAAHRRELAARDELVAGLRRELDLRDALIASLRRELEAVQAGAAQAAALDALRAEVAHLSEGLGRRRGLFGG